MAQPGTDTPNVSTELSSPITLLFIPFYVPPGARACDSAFSLASYIGTWTESFWSAYVENVLHSSPRRGSSVSFRSLVPGSSGSELRKFNTVWKTFTSTERLSRLWTLGTRFRGCDCSGLGVQKQDTKWRVCNVGQVIRCFSRMDDS